MSYAADHAGVLATLAEDGAAVTFTPAGTGTYVEASDTWTSASGTPVAGYAVGVRGDLVRYRALGLTVERTATLLFTGSTYGDVPAPGYTTTWGGQGWTVRIVEPFAPDGTAIHARIIMDR